MTHVSAFFRAFGILSTVDDFGGQAGRDLARVDANELCSPAHRTLTVIGAL